MTAGISESMDRRVAGRLAGRLASRVQTADLPRTAQIISWIDLVDLCRELDESLVAADAPSAEVLTLHEAVVNLAIGCGGWLIYQIRANQIDISDSGQTVESLEASLEMLRIFQRSWHGDFPPGEVEAVRQHIFKGAA